MKTCGSWIQFNFECHQWEERLVHQSETDVEELRAWAVQWLLDPEMRPLEKGGYFHSWLTRVSSLLGRSETLRLASSVMKEERDRERAGG